jgi:hypothetical protein
VGCCPMTHRFAQFHVNLNNKWSEGNLDRTADFREDETFLFPFSVFEFLFSFCSFLYRGCKAP